MVGTGLVTLDAVLVSGTDGYVAHWAGGTCGNVLSALAFLDWQAVPVARMGQDHAAAALARDLESQGVETLLVRRESASATPVIVEHLREAGDGTPVHRFAFDCPTCGRFLPRYRPVRLDHADEALEYLGSPNVFFFDRVSPASLRMAAAYRERGVLVVFEPAGIGELKDFERALRLSHVVKYARDRVGAEMKRLGGLLRVATQGCPELEIETLGAGGLRYRLLGPSSSRRWRLQSAPPVRYVRDTAGAGDWCTAGLLYELAGARESVQDEELVAKALRFGQALASVNCQFVGPRGGAYVLGRDEMLTQADAVVRGINAYFPPRDPHLFSKVVSAPSCQTCLPGSATESVLSLETTAGTEVSVEIAAA